MCVHGIIHIMSQRSFLATMNTDFGSTSLQTLKVLPSTRLFGSLNTIQLDTLAGNLQAAYLRVPAEAKANLAKEGMSEQWREGLHAAMHAMQNVVPLHMMCGPNDLGAECDNPYSARFRPDRLLLYDKCPGGIGLAYRVIFC